MAVLPLRTARLTLRVMQPADAPVAAAYRNDPEVARLQDWPMPYTLDRAASGLAKQAALTDLSPNGWTSVAIEHEGELIGDLAVQLDPEHSQAGLGYTLSRAAQHRGFASEAAEAMVDALFALDDVRRIVVTLDDDNYASMRVIEPLGFRFEGIAKRAVLIRGEWVDDSQFALLREERAEWLARPHTPPATVELVELVHETAAPYAALATHRFQQAFVAPMALTFRHALLPEEVDGARVIPWFRGIAADGVPVGFMMIAEAAPEFPFPYLWRLLIDRWHQRRGIGLRAMNLLIDKLRAEGHTQLVTSWGEGLGSPEPFYRGLGFKPTGNLVDDVEIEASLAL